MNTLERWLKNGSKRIEALFKSQETGSSTSSQRGPYKTKGTTQSKRTQQRHAKDAQDWTKKMRESGFKDIRELFSKSGSQMIASNGSDEPPLIEYPETLQDEEDVPLGPLSHCQDSAESRPEALQDEEDASLGPLSHCQDSADETLAREEDGFGDIPEAVIDAAGFPIPSFNARPNPQPLPPVVDNCIGLIENILKPRRKRGPGHLDPMLNFILRARLEVMANFLRIYRIQGYEGWIKASELAAIIAGKNKTLARRLREWTHAIILDPTNLPVQEYGKWNVSVSVI
jgi:hypothetical protein